MFVQRLVKALVDSVKEGIDVSRKILPTILFLVILIKILQELNLVSVLAIPLSPIMDLMGLPSELGIVWATAMLVGVYPALAIIPSILGSMPALTVEQVTVLGLVILFAHGLIIETKIAGQCGVSMRFQVFLRVVVAIVTGVCVHLFCSSFGLWQEEAVMFLVPAESAHLVAWAQGELWNFVQIFIMICLIMAFNKALNYLRISHYCGILLTPVLRLLGVSPQTTNVMLVGIFMGILYGGGIIMQVSKEGKISACDNFAVMSFMGLSHALIEDTVLLMLIGASLWGLIGIRLVVSLSVGLLINVLYLKRSKECLQA